MGDSRNPLTLGRGGCQKLDYLEERKILNRLEELEKELKKKRIEIDVILITMWEALEVKI